MGAADKKRVLVVTNLDDVPAYVPPEYPKVVKRSGRLTLAVEEGREYELNGGMERFLGLLHHLSAKTWCDGEFVNLAIERVAEAKGWELKVG